MRYRVDADTADKAISVATAAQAPSRQGQHMVDRLTCNLSCRLTSVDLFSGLSITGTARSTASLYHAHCSAF